MMACLGPGALSLADSARVAGARRESLLYTLRPVLLPAGAVGLAREY